MLCRSRSHVGVKHGGRRQNVDPSVIFTETATSARLTAEDRSYDAGLLYLSSALKVGSTTIDNGPILGRHSTNPWSNVKANDTTVAYLRSAGPRRGGMIIISSTPGDEGADYFQFSQGALYPRSHARMRRSGVCRPGEAQPSPGAAGLVIGRQPFATSPTAAATVSIASVTVAASIGVESAIRPVGLSRTPRS
jgi:hypothetical protein